MTHYNKLPEVSYNPKNTSWRFRVKIHRIYPFYFYVTSSVPFYKYVLADEEGTKMEMIIYGNSDSDSRIKCVATGAHAYAFRDGLENMKGRGQVIVVLKMWRVWKFLSYFGPPDLWLETEGGLSDFRFNPRLPEVEEFRQSLLRSDPYVQRYGAVCLL
ncbi:hypothetical protein F2Q68_00008660 [Brassica cretica]|uniref:Uncharacterized protein n=2 Tax=Brassica cretica TaxID=69181 RepID=A0A8S9KUV7_BRACR|nr:hypothetical protein F2Q68_00008660 [Brassica cretica]